MPGCTRTTPSALIWATGTEANDRLTPSMYIVKISAQILSYTGRPSAAADAHVGRPGHGRNHDERSFSFRLTPICI